MTLEPHFLFDLELDTPRYVSDDDIEATEIYQRDVLNTAELVLRKSISGGRLMPEPITLLLDNSAGIYSDKVNNGDIFKGKKVKWVRRDENDSPTSTTLLYATVSGFSFPAPNRFELTVRMVDPDAFQSPFPYLRYDRNASIWSTGTNGTTIIAPDFDQGKIFAIPFGHDKKKPLRYVRKNTVADQYDYCCIGPCEADTGDENSAKCYVYVGNQSQGFRLVTTGYTIYAGGAGDPYPGYFTVRFDGQQLDPNGNQLEVCVDVYGLTMGGATANRDFATTIKECLSNTTWGMSLSVDSDAFSAAATILSDPSGDGYPLYCDGGLSEEKTLQTVIDELAVPARCFIYENTDGEWAITVDSYSSSVDAYFGLNHSYGHNNIIENSFKRKTLDTDQQTRNLTIRYRWNQWNGEYANSLEYAVNDEGEDREVELWSVRDHRTADLIGCYLQQRELNSDPPIEFDAGMDARFVGMMDVLDVEYNFYDRTGALKNLAGGDDGAGGRILWQVRGQSIKRDRFSIEAWKNSADTYAYDEHSSYPSDGELDDTQPDYSGTPPGAPSNLAVTETTQTTIEGHTVGVVVIQADELASNFASMQLGYRKSGVDNYTMWPGEDQDDDGTWKLRVEGLIPGEVYEYCAQCINAYGLPGTLATLSPGSAFPGDTSTPAQVSGVDVEVKYKTVKATWNAVTLDTLGASLGTKLAGYHVQIGNSTFSTVYWQSSYPDLVTATNKTWQAPDAHAYGTAYYVRVRAYTKSGNVGAWSSSDHASSAQTQNSDIGSGLDSGKLVNVLSTTLIPNLTAAKITSGTFDPVLIPNLAASIITSGTLDPVRIPNLAASKITSGTFDPVLIPNLSATKITSGTLTITSSMGISLATGANITMNFTAAATASIYWDGGALGDLRITGSSTTQGSAPYTDHPTLNIHSVSDGLGYLNIGGPGTSNRWYYALIKATNTISLYAGSTHGILIQTNGIYLNGGVVYFASNWELYPNSTTSMRIRYSGTWKLDVDTSGNLTLAGSLGESGSRISKLWSSAIDNYGNYYSDTGYVHLAAGYLQVGSWKMQHEGGTNNLVFSYSGTTRMYITTSGDVWVNDSVDGYKRLTY